MKYLLSIVLLALIGFTTPKKTIPAYDWGSVSAEPKNHKSACWMLDEMAQEVKADEK